jgi:hypothetical protein
MLSKGYACPFYNDTQIVLENMIRLRVADREVHEYLGREGHVKTMVGGVEGEPINSRYHYGIFKARFMTEWAQSSTEKPDFKFGDMVSFEQRIDRCAALGDDNPFYLYWREYPLRLKDSDHGLFVGYRTLKNGFVEERPDGSRNKFIMDRTLKVALVCKNGNTAPRRYSIHGMRKI